MADRDVGQYFADDVGQYFADDAASPGGNDTPPSSGSPSSSSASPLSSSSASSVSVDFFLRKPSGDEPFPAEVRQSQNGSRCVVAEHSKLRVEVSDIPPESHVRIMLKRNVEWEDIPEEQQKKLRQEKRLLEGVLFDGRIDDLRNSLPIDLNKCKDLLKPVHGSNQHVRWPNQFKVVVEVDGDEINEHSFEYLTVSAQRRKEKRKEKRKEPPHAPEQPAQKKPRSPDDPTTVADATATTTVADATATTTLAAVAATAAAAAAAAAANTTRPAELC